MKIRVIIAFLLCSLAGLTQKITRLEMKRSELANVKLVSDLVPEIFADSESMTTVVVGLVNGRVISVSGSRNTLSESQINLLETADINSKVFISMEVFSENKKSLECVILIKR